MQDTVSFLPSITAQWVLLTRVRELSHTSWALYTWKTTKQCHTLHPNWRHRRSAAQTLPGHIFQVKAEATQPTPRLWAPPKWSKKGFSLEIPQLWSQKAAWKYHSYGLRKQPGNRTGKVSESSLEIPQLWSQKAAWKYHSYGLRKQPGNTTAMVSESSLEIPQLWSQKAAWKYHSYGLRKQPGNRTGKVSESSLEIGQGLRKKPGNRMGKVSDSSLKIGQVRSQKVILKEGWSLTEGSIVLVLMPSFFLSF